MENKNCQNCLLFGYAGSPNNCNNKYSKNFDLECDPQFYCEDHTMELHNDLEEINAILQDDNIALKNKYNNVINFVNDYYNIDIEEMINIIS